MSNGIPTRIGPYEITREIGRGGMGVVYLARDTKLDRDVAIKCLPEELSDDADRLARFEREAKLLASLNHPNIATVHGLEEVDNKRYLILEYVEGDTLEERLRSGPMDLDEALLIAIQIANAIEAAHDKGIIHRDLKPANIKFTTDDQVKVLDFGLAKALDEQASSITNIANSPTIMKGASPTLPGVILGTAGYLSPEQARGRTVDKRTDIFSFGCVLYEMLSGLPSFPGETAADSIGATLHKDTDFNQLPPNTPMMVKHVLNRCLQRDRNKRLRDIGDVRLELTSNETEQFLQSDEQRTSNTRLIAISVICCVLLGLGGLIIGRLTSTSGESESHGLVHLQIGIPDETELLCIGDLAGPAVVSPDGSTIAFVARKENGLGRIWLRSLDEPDAHPLTGTEMATFPFWSPDGRSLGFFISERLRRIDLDGGSVYTVCRANAGRGGTWTINDEIIFTPGFRDPILQVPASGGEPTALTTIDESLHTSHRWPFMLDDGLHFLFTAINHDPMKQEEGALMLGSLDGKPPRRVFRSMFKGEVVRDHLLFVSEGNLVAAPFDVATASITDTTTTIAQSLLTDPSTWYAVFSASERGVLAFHKSSTEKLESNAQESSGLAMGTEANVITVLDRLGQVKSRMVVNIPQMSHRLSPDGSTLAISSTPSDQKELDIWLYPTGYGQKWTESRDTSDAEIRIFQERPTRLTNIPGVEVSPTWSPDSTQIAYGRVWGKPESRGIFKKQIGGGTEECLIPADPDGADQWPNDWSRDGKWIIFTRGDWTLTKGDILAISTDGGEVRELVATEDIEDDGRISPDGRWLVFTASAKTHGSEAYVIPFAPAWPNLTIDPHNPQPIWQVSVSGGDEPTWRSDGKELIYISWDSTVMSAATEIDGDIFKSQPGIPLFQSSWEPGKVIDMLPDGSRFFLSDVSQVSDEPISVLLNWHILLNNGSESK